MNKNDYSPEFVQRAIGECCAAAMSVLRLFHAPTNVRQIVLDRIKSAMGPALEQGVCVHVFFADADGRLLVLTMDGTETGCELDMWLRELPVDPCVILVRSNDERAMFWEMMQHLV